MNCIICFLKDSYQTRLRNIARLKRDRFEDAIDEYKKLFLAEFDALCDVQECPDHSDVKEETLEWCRELHSTLEKINDLDQWFDEIKQVYVTWIGGEFSNSLSQLGKVLDKHEIFKEKNASEYVFCIRGRKSSSALSKNDLFHIPFNKRHLVSNQRFSITGLPLLYLGLSPVDIFYELRANDPDLSDLYFSSFVLKNPSSLTIADLTNQFPHIYSNFKGLHDVGSPVRLNDQIFGNMEKESQIEFYKFALSSLCSFQVLERFEGGSFVEEYVLPQLLSEKVRQKGFDGISYSSTRVTNKDCYSEEVFHTNKYRENIVLFTRYSGKEDYNTKLLDKFDISRPVRLAEMHDIEPEEVERLKKEIIQLNNVTNKIPNLDLLSEYSGARFKVHYEKLMVKNSDNIFATYQDHDLGKIHFYLLYQHMLSIRNWLK